LTRNHRIQQQRETINYAESEVLEMRTFAGSTALKTRSTAIRVFNPRKAQHFTGAPMIHYAPKSSLLARPA
jgi:hypothetical protein